MVTKTKVVDANALNFDSKTREAREAKHMDLGVEVFSWFKQQPGHVRHATKVLPFAKKCGVREQLSKHSRRIVLGKYIYELTFFFYVEKCVIG